MTERNYNLNIKTTADTKGAKQAEKATEDLTEANTELRKIVASSTILTKEQRKEFTKLADQIDSVQIQAEDTARGIDLLSKSKDKAKTKSGDLGRATLEASRAYEDLQFGIVGVLNNIPGLITSLGGTAGLAGVISIVSVAAFKLVPALLDTSDAVAKLQFELDNTRQAEERAEERKRKLTKATEDVQRATRGLLEEFDRASQASGYLDFLDSVNKRLQDQRKLVDELADERLQLQLAQIEANPNLTPEQRRLQQAQARDTFRQEGQAREQARLQEDVAALIERLERVNFEAQRINNEGQAAARGQRSSLDSISEREAQLRRRIGFREAGLDNTAARIGEVDVLDSAGNRQKQSLKDFEDASAFFSFLEANRDRVRTRGGIGNQINGAIDSNNRLIRQENELEVLSTQREEAEKALQEILNQTQTSLDGLNQKTANLTDELEKAQNRLAQNEQIFDLRNQRGAITLNQEQSRFESATAEREKREADAAQKTQSGLGNDASKAGVEALRTLRTEFSQRGGNRSQFDQLSGPLREALQALDDGATEEETRKVVQAINQLGSAIKVNDTARRRELRQLRDQVNTVAEQIKNSR